MLRMSITSANVSMTPRLLMRRATRMARHSRVYSSIRGHEPNAATIMGLGFDKVIAPDVIAMPWPEPDARAVIQPEPASWPMFSGYLDLSPSRRQIRWT